jgi:polysaccharide deacetylase family sporulation protein PdaB
LIIIASKSKLRWIATALSASVLTLVALGLATPDGIVENPDSAPVSAALQPDLRPIYSAKTDKKVVSLTFDISWGTKTPPLILDILRQENVKATFFLSGPWSRDHAAVVEQIVKDGHQVESHGHAHVDLNNLGREGAAKNIAQAHAILEGLSGRAPTYIRPPNGALNKESVQAAKDLGYATVVWSVDSLDWKNPGVDAIISRTTRLVHPGAIILMHASDTCKQTHLALPTVLKNLREKGYSFVSLDHLVREYGVDPNGRIQVRQTAP